MKTQDAFREDILAHPEDDTPRLIFADWLDEHGQPERGEYIRVQIELARLDEDDPRWPELESRAMELIRQHEKKWARRETESLGGCYFWARGFVEGVEFVKYTDFLAAAPRLFQLCPIRYLTIEAPFFHFKRWSACPHLANLRGLALRRFARRKWDADSLAQAIAPPTLAGLTELDLNGNFYLGAPWGQALARAGHLENLTALRLAGNGIEDEGVRHLLRGKHLGKLTALDLSGNYIGPEGAAALAESPLLAGLTELGLGIEEDFDDANSIGDEGVRALVASPHLTRLRQLDLSSDIGMPDDPDLVGDQGAEALASWPHLVSVRRLLLDYNRITSRGVRALAASARAVNLTHLGLYGNPIDDDGARSLLRSRKLKKLRTLQLETELLSPAVCEALEEHFGEGFNPDD
jgi:uncharacterized protein (TIGR02996 family)